MKHLTIALVLSLLAGCGPMEPRGATQHRIFLECMNSVEQERVSTHEDSWNRVVDACRAYSYGVALRMRREED